MQAARKVVWSGGKTSRERFRYSEVVAPFHAAAAQFGALHDARRSSITSHCAADLKR